VPRERNYDVVAVLVAEVLGPAGHLRLPGLAGVDPRPGDPGRVGALAAVAAYPCRARIVSTADPGRGSAGKSHAARRLAQSGL